MAQTFLYGSLIQSGSIPATALGGGVVSSSTQLPAGTISSSTGTTNYIPLWTGTTAQSASSIYQLTGNVGIGTLVPSASLHVSGGLALEKVFEKANITGSAPPATFNVDVTSGSIFFRSGSTSANWTLNFRGDVNNTLNSVMYTGQILTATVLTIQGATPYSASTVQIDGASVTPKWQGGTSSSNASSLEVSTYTIIKIASASYNVLASVTKYV